MALMSLGSFVMDDKLPVNTMQRTTTARHVKSERLNQWSARQWTGPNGETAQITGAVFPLSHGAGVKQLDALREAQETGQALAWANGHGEFLGTWLIQSIQEEPSNWLPGGAPRRQRFTIQLARQAPDLAPESPSPPVEAAPLQGEEVEIVESAAAPLPQNWFENLERGLFSKKEPGKQPPEHWFQNLETGLFSDYGNISNQGQYTPASESDLHSYRDGTIRRGRI